MADIKCSRCKDSVQSAEEIAGQLYCSWCASIIRRKGLNTPVLGDGVAWPLQIVAGLMMIGSGVVCITNAVEAGPGKTAIHGWEVPIFWTMPLVIAFGSALNRLHTTLLRR